MGRHDRIAELADLAEPGPGLTLTIADLGAGYGRTVRALLAAADDQGRAVRIHAVDTGSGLDDDVLGDARVRSVIADLDAPLPFDNGSLHRLISADVAEHLADPRAHLNECYRVLAPGGLLVLSHCDWDTTMFASDDDALTRRLVDRFVGAIPMWAQRADGFMGRKLLGLARSTPFEIASVQTWADAHLRFDEDSVAWKVARGVLTAASDDAQLAAQAAAWVAGLRKLAQDGRFLFTVTEVAVVLRKPAEQAH